MIDLGKLQTALLRAKRFPQLLCSVDAFGWRIADADVPADFWRGVFEDPQLWAWGWLILPEGTYVGACQYEDRERARWIAWHELVGLPVPEALADPRGNWSVQVGDLREAFLATCRG